MGNSLGKPALDRFGEIHLALQVNLYYNNGKLFTHSGRIYFHIGSNQDQLWSVERFLVMYKGHVCLHFLTPPPPQGFFWGVGVRKYLWDIPFMFFY